MASELLSKHQRKVMERNETTSVAKRVNERLQEVDNEIEKINNSLNSAQEVINSSRPSKAKDALQATVKGQREIQNNGDTQLKRLFERFDEITRDLTRMDTVIVTSADLQLKQK